MDLEPFVSEALAPDEHVQARARATEAVLAVSDRRLIVAARDRIVLSIGFDRLRRIQFDIERSRPATMVIVPEEAHDEPQVLAIPPTELRATAEALAVIGEQLVRHTTGGDRSSDS